MTRKRKVFSRKNQLMDENYAQIPFRARKPLVKSNKLQKIDPIGWKKTYTHVKRNIFVSRSRNLYFGEDVNVCFCEEGEDCGQDCINRLTNQECHPGFCENGKNCSNMRFQKQEYPAMEIFWAGNKGWGVKPQAHVSCGDFIIEYCGEVISGNEMTTRLHKYSKREMQNPDQYIMAMGNNEYVDATVKGNLARFINHSCNPNCRTEKWEVMGEVCVGIFAIRDIEASEEFTYDYQFHTLSKGGGQICHCGCVGCRGKI